MKNGLPTATLMSKATTRRTDMYRRPSPDHRPQAIGDSCQRDYHL
jgi:hypothetical protein